VVLDRPMVGFLALVLAVFHSLFKAPARLETENLALRQQLIASALADEFT
jgi:hypothetical protein